MQTQLDPKSIPSIPGARIVILQSKWYRSHIDKMVAKCIKVLKGTGCLPIERHIVPGCLELPLAAQTLLRNASAGKHFDAVICFGAIMKGETYHFDVIKDECIRGLGQVMLKEGTPIIVEVIPVLNIEQLIARSKNDGFNKGIEAALATAEIIAWRRKVLAQKKLTKPIRIHVVAGEIHKKICEQMIAASRKLNKELGTFIEQITWVPGSLEAPLAVKKIIENHRPDAIVVFGVQQKGKTKHGEVIAHNATNKLLKLQLKYRMPMAIAIIGPNTTLIHASGKAITVAQKSMRAAVRMVKLEQ